MDEAERQRILDEARANVADREPGHAVAPCDRVDNLPPLADPLERWRAEAAQADRARERATRERRRNERDVLAARQVDPAEFWAAIDARVELLVARRIKQLIPEIFEGISAVNDDVQAAITRVFDVIDGRLASVEELLNRRSSVRSVPIDEQSPLRRVN